MTGTSVGIGQHSETLIYALIAFDLALLLAFIIFGIRLYHLQTKWGGIFGQAEGKKIEVLLLDHLREQMKTTQTLSSLGDRLDKLETAKRTSRRHTGMVRYDAFPDVGGSQSFAMALLDDEGSGVVMTSHIGRQDCRVYCKAIERGKSGLSLSQEELKAIQQARAGSEKAG